MNILNEILDRYQSADMGTRLNMYLQYRNVRDEFILMDLNPEENAGKWLKFAEDKEKATKRRLNMNFSSAQSFVQKMKENREFREHFQCVSDSKALWKNLRKEGYKFDKKDLIKAMAECMNELETCGSSSA